MGRLQRIDWRFERSPCVVILVYIPSVCNLGHTAFEQSQLLYTNEISTMGFYPSYIVRPTSHELHAQPCAGGLAPNCIQQVRIR